MFKNASAFLCLSATEYQFYSVRPSMMAAAAFIAALQESEIFWRIFPGPFRRFFSQQNFAPFYFIIAFLNIMVSPKRLWVSLRGTQSCPRDVSRVFHFWGYRSSKATEIPVSSGLSSGNSTETVDTGFPWLSDLLFSCKIY